VGLSNRPLAAPGLTSYRFTTVRGSHVMIGAKDTADALREASRSTSDEGTLYVWDGTQYVRVPLP
jgi:hypothetical protein